MKKILFPVLIVLIASGIAIAEPQKPHECPMAKMKKCAGLCPEKMKGVETVSKNTEKGVEITMTAKDKETTAKVQEMALVHYNAKDTMEAGCPGRVEGAQIKVTNIENGARAEITGTTPEMIKKIQDASLKEHKPAASAKGMKPNSKKEVKKIAKYACPMGCATSDKPGKCPKCGMTMTEKK